MIKRIVKINNVGRFRNAPCSGVEFKKVTYIRALNTYGKSTLCDIFKSSNSEFQYSLNERKSIPPFTSDKDQFVHYTFLNNGTEKNVKYKTDTWVYDNEIKEKTQDILVFDNKFVEDNVFYGGKIEFQNSSNLTSFLISNEAIVLQNELIDLKETQRQNTSKISTLKKTFRSSSMTLENLAKLTPNMTLIECNSKIDELNGRLKTLHESKNSLSDIKAKTINILNVNPYSLNYKIMMEKLEKCLNTSFKEVSQSILNHLEHNTTNSNKGLQWVIDGTTLTRDHNCPYCGQDTSKCEIVNEYSKIISQNLSSYISEVDNTLASIIFKDFIHSDLENLEKNMENAKFIDKYLNNKIYTNLICEIEKEYLDFKKNTLPNYYNEVENIKKNLATVISLKKNSPLSIISIFDSSNFISEYENCRDFVNLLNTRITSIKALSDEFIKNTSTENIMSEIKLINEAHKKLILFKEFLDNETTINEYLELEKEAKIITKKIKEKSQQLETTSSEFLEKYHGKVNELFKKFGSNDFVLDIEVSNQGSKQTWKLVPKYHNQKISLSDIRNLFSESDKRSLALSIFLAKIEDDLSNKIIILDDPSTSFDDNRIFAINNYLLTLSKQVKQLIITSHYGQADLSFKRIFSSEDVAFLAISQTNDNTSILTKDEFTIKNYDSEFKNLYQIAYENKQEDIDILKSKVRIFTENYLKHRFKIYLINSEHNTLGSIINFLKNTTNAITEEQALLYESINKSYSPSHHEYESYNFEDTKLVLLSIFEDMKH